MWLRWLRLLLGSTAPATSATLVAFFAGQAAGAALAARRIARVGRPLAAYGALELAAALASLAVPLLLRAGEGLVDAGYAALQDTPAALATLRFGVALAATLPAALCFGATLPVLGAAVIGAPAALGSRGTLLYAANTLGGAAGAILAAFLLPPWLGIAGSYAVGLGGFAAAGLGALALARGVPRVPDRADAPARTEPGSEGRRRDARKPAAERAARRPSERRLLALATLSGFGSFAAQVLLVQAFALVLNQSVYAFGSVLVIVLAGLAAGSLLGTALEVRGAGDAPTRVALALAAAAIALAAFPAAFTSASGGLAYLGTERPWPGYLLAALRLALIAAGPVVLAAALVLPGVLALAARSEGTAPAGARLGSLLAANTAGSLAGALAAPFVLLPALGLWPAFAALALFYAVACVFVPMPSVAARWTRDLALGLGWIAVLSTGNPLTLPLVPLRGDEQVVYQDTTAAGVVSVVLTGGELRLQTDNHYALGGTAERVHQERQGLLPMLLHPQPRRVAHVGSATGISAGASLAWPGLERLFAVELVPGVARAGALVFRHANRGVYDDPRTTVVLDDGRHFVRATREHFDVLVADLFVPWHAGAGSLYAREHLQAVAERLAPGGLFCQWLPLYQLSETEFQVIAATFAEVFPRAALFRGDFYGRFPILALLGFEDGPAPAETVSAAAERLAAAGERDRWITDPMGPWALYVGPLAAAHGWLEGAALHTDDRPVIEFLAARSHAGAGLGKRDPFVGLELAAFTEQLRLVAAARGDPVFPDLGPEALRSSEGGALLQLAGALFTAGRLGESARALAAASAALPARLVAEAPADPTAAEVWRNRD
jgi:spermidine synthase